MDFAFKPEAEHGVVSDSGTRATVPSMGCTSILALISHSASAVPILDLGRLAGYDADGGSLGSAAAAPFALF